MNKTVLAALVVAILVGCDGSKIITEQSATTVAETDSNSSSDSDIQSPSTDTTDANAGPVQTTDETDNAASTTEETEVTDLLPGDRAAWLRGSWGINWNPSELSNGKAETLTIDALLDQIENLRTIDYVQFKLGESYIYSPVHLAPHATLESLWQGDNGADGKPINLVVPRASAGVDPFYKQLTAVKNAGLKTMVYVNSSNMLERDAQTPNPEAIPDISNRWRGFCDSDNTVQAYLAKQAFRDDAAFPNRKYMFCYAEVVLKEYSQRYGTLIDAWIFDSGRYMEENGDNATNGELEDQRIYEAFASAARSGNPMAAVSFNNGPERETEALNPFSEAVRHEDFMFGHPYNGGRVIGNRENGLYDRNYAHIQKIVETGGSVHAGGIWTWDDNIVGHFDPPMSTTSWSGGKEPALPDEDFLLWNLQAVAHGGAISWGVPLHSATRELDQLLIRDWAMSQLTLMDEHLQRNQTPGAPQWSRAYTILPTAEFGKTYQHTLTDSHDFWDPEGDEVTLTLAPGNTDVPPWLSLERDLLNADRWVLSGLPTELIDTRYEFTLQATDASATTERTVSLVVTATATTYPVTGSADVFATANTSYGTDNTATMISEFITAPDGKATFQIAFDVTPTPGSAITSTQNTNATTERSWGPDNGMFNGDTNDTNVSVHSLRVVNFTANGGSLAESDITMLSFEYVEIADGQSSGDRIHITVDGIDNESGGSGLATNPGKMSVKLVGNVAVEDFVIGVGTTNVTNKWSVNSIGVSYQVN